MTTRSHPCPFCSQPLVLPAEIQERWMVEVATHTRRRSPMRAMHTVRFRFGSDLVASKMVVGHITTRPGECHRCHRPLPGDPIVACPACRALNLDWPDEGGIDYPPRFAPGRLGPRTVIDLERCPACDSALGPGVTRCWSPGCDFVLPEGALTRGASR